MAIDHLGVSLNERVHLVACQLDDFARLTGAEPHHGGATEEHAGFTSELTRPLDGDQGVAQARGTDDLD
jgi:hypothetical protein